MNLKFATLALALAAMPTLASAQNLDFTGEIVASTCDASNTGDLAVDLGKVDVRNFAASGDTAGRSAVNISLTCSAASQVAVRISNSNGGVNPATGRLVPTAPGGETAATGVEIGLFDVTGAAQGVNAAPTNFTAVGTGNPAILAYTAAYVSTGSVTPGKANASATFELAYQ